MRFSVLVVEDHLANARFLLRVLTDAGYDGVHAQNVTEAIQQLRVRTPDLILLDLVLQGLSGIQFLDICAEDGLAQGVPVIVVTALFDAPGVTDSLRQRAVRAILPKPVGVQELLGAVQQCLGTDPAKMDPST